MASHRDTAATAELLRELDQKHHLTMYQVAELTGTDSGQWYRRMAGELGMGLSATVKLVKGIYKKNPALAVWIVSKLFGIDFELKQAKKDESAA